MRTAIRRVVTGLLAVGLVAAVIGAIAIAVLPLQTTAPFSEFYVTAPNGSTSLSTNVSTGEVAELQVGVENYEHEPTEYTVVVSHDDVTIYQEHLSLEDGERWQETVRVSFQSVGEQRVNLRLYREGPSGEPYRRLHVTYNVTKTR